MREINIYKLLGRIEGGIGLDENLFEDGFLDSLSALELLEQVSKASGISTIDLAADISQISTMRKIMTLTGPHKGSE